VLPFVFSVIAGVLWATTFVIRLDETISPFSLAAERCGIIYEERLLNGLERPRFSTHLVRQNRLVEYENLLARRKLHCYSIAQQYEDLRNAFSRSPNTDAEEDYCHFKAIDFRQQAEHLTLEQQVRGNPQHPHHWTVKLFVLGVCVAIVVSIAVVVGFFWPRVELSLVGPSKPVWGETRHDPLIATSMLAMIPLVAGLLTLAFYALWYDFEILCKWAARRTFLQLIGAGLYPSRTILSGGLIMILFAFVYLAASYSSIPIFGSVVNGDGDLLIEGNVGDIWRAMYFSIVTFTTLGYGDYHPTGALKLVAAFEALVGAIMIAIVTVSIARQYLRK